MLLHTCMLAGLVQWCMATSNRLHLLSCRPIMVFFPALTTEPFWTVMPRLTAYVHSVLMAVEFHVRNGVLLRVPTMRLACLCLLFRTLLWRPVWLIMLFPRMLRMGSCLMMSTTVGCLLFQLTQLSLPLFTMAWGGSKWGRSSSAMFLPVAVPSVRHGEVPVPA